MALTVWRLLSPKTQRCRKCVSSHLEGNAAVLFPGGRDRAISRSFPQAACFWKAYCALSCLLGVGWVSRTGSPSRNGEGKGVGVSELSQDAEFWGSVSGWGWRGCVKWVWWEKRLEIQAGRANPGPYYWVTPRSSGDHGKPLVGSK